jgi:hypothetical protein
MPDRTIRLITLTLVAMLAALLAIWLVSNYLIRPAQADGCNPEMQDCSVKGSAYVPEALPKPKRAAPVAYTYSVTPEIIRKRGGSKCGKNIPVWECELVMSKIRAEDQRRARTIAKKQKPPVREARDSYRDERGRKVIVIDDSSRRRRERDEDYGERDSRDCRRRITVTSKPRITKSLACGEARKLWSMRALDEHGGEFARISNAKGAKSDPHPFHEGAWRDVCTFSAVPCRSDRRDD